MEDPRQQGKVDYPLQELLLLVVCGVLAGADSWVEIAKFGEEKLDFLRRHALDVACCDKTKGALTGKIKRAGWDDEFLLKML